VEDGQPERRTARTRPACKAPPGRANGSGTQRYLHPILLGSDGKPGVTGQKAGEHAFRRYRDGYLRTQGCPAGLLKYWLGHSRTEDMSDLYDGSVIDEAYRLEMSEKLGTGLIVSSCTECTEKEKEATGAVASK
jgi:hypothetical protein